jgi:hypothetical protein
MAITRQLTVKRSGLCFVECAVFTVRPADSLNDGTTGDRLVDPPRKRYFILLKVRHGGWHAPMGEE